MSRFFNNLSTSAKFILSFTVILLLLGIVIFVAYSSLNTMAQSELTLQNVYGKSAINLQQLRSHMNFNRAEMLEMMMTEDPVAQENSRQLVQERSRQIDDMMVELAQINADAEFQRQLAELKTGLDDYRQTREEVIRLIFADEIEAARQLNLSTGTREFELIRSLTVDLGADTIDALETRMAEDQARSQSAITLFGVIGLVAILLTIGLVAILNQTIATPLNRIAELAEQIGSGDLTVSVPQDNRRDEIGVLTRAFRQMVETLRRSTKDISQAVGLLGSSASEILASTTQVAAGTVETSTSINETTTTVEEVRQAVQLSSQKAQNVSDNAQRVAQVSQSGRQAVEETSTGMERIRVQMETIAQTVVRLSEQSQSIGGIIASVTDLADQSNLLAVNAAIEAAKAGEQGRGFAVVAQEIKSLAEQSKQATAQVRGILSDVQKATSSAVLATEQGTKAVDAGVKQASQAGEAIRVLAKTSEEAVQAATQIVASSQQQVVGMNQIGVAMENINQAGAQNAISMRQMEVAAQDLNHLGQKLRELVDQFQV